jgi:hypothetical protein
MPQMQADVIGEKRAKLRAKIRSRMSRRKRVLKSDYVNLVGQQKIKVYCPALGLADTVSDCETRTNTVGTKQEKDVNKMTEIRTVSVVPDGAHLGVISSVETITQPYKYVRLFIATDGFKDVKLRLDFPDAITIDDAGRPRSLYAKVATRLGFRLEKGKAFDEKKFVGVKIAFETETEETERGTFNRIVAESIKLA